MPSVSSARKALPVVTPFMGLLGLLIWYVQDNGFFWDSILLASRYGQWYYQTNFSTLFVPPEMAGYPPLFGMYMAAGWHLFGKTVPVSHWLMFPFLLGVVWQVYLLTRRYVPSAWLFGGMLLIFLDPTLLAQSAQVAPDIVLLFLYLVCLNALLQHRPLLLGVALVFMALHTPRSQILLVAVFFTHVFVLWQQHRKFSFQLLLKTALPYIPAGLVLLLWLGLHYLQFGWIGFSRASDWGAYSALVTPKEFFRNLALIIWRLVDFGRVALWLTVIFLIWQSRARVSASTKEILILLLVPLVVLTGTIVWFTNPIGHRYYLVVYVLLGLLTAHLLQQVLAQRLRIPVLLALMLSLVSGHFWLYPETVAKGWDATLAHVPYFSLRQEMMSYIDQQQIPWQQVGSAFPNLASPADTDLTQDQRQFAPKDLRHQPYILHSNVFNGFSDEELQELTQEWVLLHEVKKGQVYMRLYGRNSSKR